MRFVALLLLAFRSWQIGLLGACLLITSGCSNLAMPKLRQPGWGDEQRARAQRYDPYPEVDWGQAMYGTRPRDFMEPAPEPQQVQNQKTFTRRFGQLAPRSRY